MTNEITLFDLELGFSSIFKALKDSAINTKPNSEGLIGFYTVSHVTAFNSNRLTIYIDHEVLHADDMKRLNKTRKFSHIGVASSGKLFISFSGVKI